MELCLNKHGDKLEREYSVLINENLSAYEMIWKKFIGNKGNATICDMKDESSETREFRVKFSEDHYTIFECLILMYHINERVSMIGDIQDIKNYLDYLNNFQAFHAHIGKIYDMIQNIEALFKDYFNDIGNIHEDLYPFWQSRVNVIHSKKIPFTIISDEMAIVKPSNKESDEYWKKNYNDWDDAQNIDIEFIKDYLSTTLYNILPKVNSILFKIHSHINVYMDEKDLTLDTSLVTTTEALSASMRNHDTVYIKEKIEDKATDASGEVDFTMVNKKD